MPILDGVDEAKDYYKANRSLEQHRQDPFAENFESFCQPAFTYKALNRLIQGSAADMTKKAMVLLFEAQVPVAISNILLAEAAGVIETSKPMF